MGKFVTGSVLVLGVAGGLAYMIARRISRETGQGLMESAAAIPQEVRRYQEEIKQRVQEAVAAGRQAAADKEREIEDILAGESGGSTSGGASAY